MQIIEYIYGKTPRAVTPPSALALGLFDGVHIGHRRLIAKTVDEAKSRGLVPGVFTFTTESALPGKRESRKIYSTEQKLKIFEELGIERVYLADFSSLCSVSRERFAEDILAEELNCRMACMGYNFRFGKNAEGDAEYLARSFASSGRESFILEEQKINGRAVSSTDVRRLLTEGNAEDAATLLGAPYFICGEVERGLGLGGKLGFPTVNTSVDRDSPLANGVYRTAVRVGEKIYNGVTDVGSCPTFGERKIHAETMILNFSGDLYGATVTVYFLGFIRQEKRFSSPEELKKQIDKDAEEVRKKNGDLKWAEFGRSSR